MKLIKISSDRVQIKTDSAELSRLKLSDLLLLSDGDTRIVCSVTSITTNDMAGIYTFDSDDTIELPESCAITCDILGSIRGGAFTKAIDVYPTADVTIETVSKEYLRSVINGGTGLCLGQYASYGIPSYVDGNKLFQRHFAILGNTGSGKSYGISLLLEKLSQLKSSNVILFDVHGEYAGLSNAKVIRIGNSYAEFPYWFLPFRDFYGSLLKLKEESATLQIAALRKAFYAARGVSKSEDLPVSYDIDHMLSLLAVQNNEEVHTGEYYKTGDRAGQAKTVKGDNNGKLNSVIALLEDRLIDQRYSFMFTAQPQSYLNTFLTELYDTTDGGVKVIDLSDIPHDMIPVVIAVITKLIYSIQLQHPRDAIRPITIICEEAHVYIPSSDFGLGASQRRLLDVFETIAKEGRKFGVTLCVSSQRPSELNKTIMAQCANFIVLKMTNEADKAMVRGFLPESGRGVIDTLTMFAPGDCLIIGDCAPITLKVKLDVPADPPRSNTIDVWDVWSREDNGFLGASDLVTILLDDRELPY